MTVKELMEQLKDLDQDLPILIAEDPEGNGFHHFDSVSESAIDASDIEAYTIESIGIRKLTDELKKRGYSDEDVKDTPCIVFWP